MSATARLRYLIVILPPPRRPLTVRLRPYRVVRNRIEELLRGYPPVRMPANSTWDSVGPERRQAEFIAVGVSDLPEVAQTWLSDRPRQHKQAVSYRYRYPALFSGAYDAEDLVQDAMLRTVPNMPGLQPGENVAGYSSVALKRLAIDKGPKRRKPGITSLSMPCNESIPTEHESPDTYVARLDLADRLYEFLWLLPARERDVLVMVGWGYSYADIAAELDIDKSTVQRRVNRARARLEPYRRLVA